MKKFIRCMGVGLLAMMLVVGCGSKAKGVSDDDLVSKDSFKGPDNCKRSEETDGR